MKDKYMRISDMLNGLAIPEAEDTQPTGTPNALAAIREKSLSAAGLAAARPIRRKARRVGRPLRILLTALLCSGLMLTALAATDLGFYLEERFGNDFAFLTKLRLMTERGQTVRASATDQDVTATVEAAYANETGAMLLLSFSDAQGRLTDNMRFSASFEQGGFGSHASTMAVKQDAETGTVYALINFISSDALKGRRTVYTIHGITARNIYREDVPTGLDIARYARLDDGLLDIDELGFVRVDEEGPLHVPVEALPGLTLTDVLLTPEGLIIEASFRAETAGVRQDSIHFSLLAPDGEIRGFDFGTNGFRMDAETGEVESIQAGFVGITEMAALEGYQLLVSYAESGGLIEGSWPLSFRMPRDTPGRTIAIAETVVAGDLTVRIEKALVTENTVLVFTKRLSPQKTIAPGATLFGEHLRGDEIELWLYRGDTPLESIGYGAVSSYDAEDEGTAIITHEGDLQNVDLCAVDAQTKDILLRIPVDDPA